MKGNYGVYNSKSQILKVEGNVNLTNKNSLEFVTSKAFFDFKKELLFSNESVTGKKEGSFITAEGFKILNKKNKIIFTGKSKLIFKNENKINDKNFYCFLLIQSLIYPQQIINQKQNGQPIEIYAEQGIEWHKNDNKYLAIGNAIARTGKMSVNSDRIEAFYEEKDNSGMDIKLVKAHKNVVVKDENLKIVGGKLAEYNLKKDYFSIFGNNLILTSEENKLESNNKMEYWRTKL